MPFTPSRVLNDPILKDSMAYRKVGSPTSTTILRQSRHGWGLAKHLNGNDLEIEDDVLQRLKEEFSGPLFDPPVEPQKLFSRYLQIVLQVC